MKHNKVQIQPTTEQLERELLRVRHKKRYQTVLKSTLCSQNE